jgi:hypothetical protein
MSDFLNNLKFTMDNLNSLAAQRAFEKANEMVDQVKSTESNEAKQRQQLNLIARNLVGQLGSMDVSPEKAGLMAQGIAPQTAKSVPEAVLSSDPFLQKQGQDLLKQEQQREIAKQDAMFKRQAQLEILKAGLDGHNKPLKDTDIAMESNVKAATRLSNQLKTLVNKYGNYETWTPGIQAELEQKQYFLAVATAKIVDPASVAREGEVEAAKKYMVPLGLSVRNQTTLESLNKYQNEIQSRYRDYRKLKVSGRAPEPSDSPNSETNDISQFLETRNK